MRRVLVVLSSILLISAGLMPPAAADSTVPVRTYTDDYFPDTDAFVTAFGCDGLPGSMGVPALAIEKDTPAPPTGLGERVWGFRPLSSHTGRFYGIGVEATHSDDLNTFGMQVYGAAAGTGRALIFAAPPGTVAGGHYLGIATVNGGGEAWTSVSAADLSYTWTEYDIANNPTGVSGGSKTLDAFLTEKGGESTIGYVAGLGFGCDGNLFHFDGFKWGASGDVTTLDFEALSSTISLDVTPQTITAGKKATLVGTVDPAFIGGTAVTLEHKPFGADQFVVLGTVTSNDFGALMRKVGPPKRTEYRWSFDGDFYSEVYADSVSPIVVVKVRTALTAAVTDPTVKKGATLVVVGATKPAKPAAIVTLWRKTSTGKKKLGATTVKTDGTYKVKANAGGRGKWKVFTTIPAGDGNVAGKSVTRTVTIS